MTGCGKGSDCPLCGTRRTERRFRAHGYWVRDCRACAHRFAELEPGADHVAAVYGDDYFEGGGAGYPGYLGDGARITARGKAYARLLRRYMRAASVLDVGAAAGFWLQGLVEEGWRGRGVEPNAAMARHARERLGLDVRRGTGEDFEPGESFDLIAMIQVLAHFTRPHAALERVATWTRPGGYWLIETWDRASLTARLFGKRWHEYSPPSVLHWFTANGVVELAARHGMTEVARGRPQRSIQAEHARSLLRHKLAGSVAGRLLLEPLKLIPGGWSLPYPGGDLFWVLLQKKSIQENP